MKRQFKEIQVRLTSRRRWRRDLSIPHGERIHAWGHRAYVGGTDPEAWYGIGKRQFHFLVSNGLQHDDRFLDIACGSLRLGQYLIPMLDEGCYFGLELEESLVKEGLDHEMLFDVTTQKSPSFAHNERFDFSFIDEFDVAMAQSLFTHMTEADISLCFSSLRPHAHERSRFFSTFFEGDPSQNPEGPSHANRDWYYRFDQLEAIATAAGWRLHLVGDWGHERGQMMTLATPEMLATEHAAV